MPKRASPKAASRADPEIAAAIAALARAARGRLERHPQGHLAGGRGRSLGLSLELPLADTAEALEETARRAERRLAREVDTLVSRLAAFRPGRVLCLRCGSAECDHAAPRQPREVFAGYGTTGIPRFLDFGEWLLERRDPRVDRLYRRPPQLVVDVLPGRTLAATLLPAFRDRATGYRIHGQVAAGWFEVPGGERTDLATTFQVVSTSGKRRPRSFGLNLLASGPEGSPVEHLYDRLGSLPWQSALAWGQSVLASIERSQSRRRVSQKLLGERIEGMLAGLGRRLAQKHRSQGRRTGHARRRHAEGDRPTRMALADLGRARADAVFVDRRRGTLVVLGEKGRAHVFNPKGKHVTSIRATPESVERKRKKEIWRPASEGEIVRLRKHSGAGAPEA